MVVWGEFGRTPKINKDAGRDHWPPVNFALLAGGGMRTGQVIGSTDKTAGLRQGPPVSFQNVFATLYHNLGIDPSLRGPRPQRPPDVSSRRAAADPRSGLIHLSVQILAGASGASGVKASALALSASRNRPPIASSVKPMTIITTRLRISSQRVTM